jgi:aspartyl-tRNA(Asn)/glutamyl-tRNA(Gln) amidotransferase subunit A
MRTIAAAAAALATGTTTSRALIDECLARIEAPNGEGARTFVRVYAEPARLMADAMDAIRRAGRAPSPYAGIPISLKDLFDIAGEPTAAGSRVLANAPPAAEHAPIVQRLLAAGFIPVGRTNMTEFAFSGLGINPHHDTPRNPWDRATGRIPGGSSSGAAVSITDGFALGALGTDTGGSCRLPAALCGIVGYKPTARRVPIEGVLPLAPSLDSVGPLAASVSCCAILDAVIAGEIPRQAQPASLSGLRLAVPRNVVMQGVDAAVGAAFERALSRLSQAGAKIDHVAFPVLDDIPAANRAGGFAAAEGYAWHRKLLATCADGYDPRIRKRIERGAGFSAADYIDLIANRSRLITSMNTDTAAYDALVMPTAPIIAPAISDLDDEAAYNRVNMLLLRNTSFGNFLDRCAISLPCHAAGEAPVGLMLMGETMGDTSLFGIATAIENLLR